MSNNNKGIVEKSNKKELRGYLNPQKVKKIVFIIIATCIILGVFISILAIWDFAERNILYRTLATLSVICIGCFIFNIVNEKFGD